MEKLYYFILLAGSFAVPFIWSFEKKISFFRLWSALFPAIVMMMLVFVSWDIIFTARGVWYFNHDYVAGYYIMGLPVEEWLFFVVIPYCIVFSYEVIRYFMPDLKNPAIALAVNIALALVFLILGIMNTGRLYTATVMLFTSMLLFLQPFLRTHKSWLSHFFFTYIIIIIPFLLVNGALTGAFTHSPVVGYNDAENLGIRLFTVPVEDAVYLMGMMLLVQMIYERIKLARKRVVQ